MKLGRISAMVALSAGILAAQAFGTPPGTDGAAAFAKLRGLAGQWEGKTADGGKSQVQYEVVSGGSAVVEHFVNDKMGAENAMVTVYFLDGGRLLLQHYCMAKNQPRMKAESFDAASGELRFTFLDAMGLTSPADGHMHNATFHFVDGDHMVQEWQFYENGKPKFTESIQYTRVR